MNIEERLNQAESTAKKALEEVAEARVKPIQGFQGYYISIRGGVYSCKNGGIKQLKLQTLFGYKYVILRRNGSEQKNMRVHRLVALAFIPEVAGKPYVNHKDGDKANNHVSNLEWCNNSENISHAFRTGLSPYKRGKNSPCAKKVAQYSLTGSLIKIWPCINDAVKKYGSGINQVLSGRYKQSHGYKWGYV